MTVFRPFRKHVKSREIVLAGLAAGILWVWFFTMHFQPVNFNFRGSRLPRGYVMPAVMRERFFPEGASDFEIEGRHLLFSTYVNRNCRVSQADRLSRKTGVAKKGFRCYIHKGTSDGE